jgi:hypothetical protein
MAIQTVLTINEVQIETSSEDEVNMTKRHKSEECIWYYITYYTKKALYAR